jgi:methylisocitrate lyase
LIKSGFLALPGAFNAYTARVIEAAGFDGVYVSGAGLANATAGVPDIGLLGLDEVARLCRYIADAVSIPVIADADTGFGGPSNAARTVREFERAGLAGLHLEDQEFPKRCGHLAGKTVVSKQEMADRLKAAADARDDQQFFIIARTDAVAVEGFDAAVDRARFYLESGADGIFPEALKSAAEFAAFAKAVDAPLMANMTEFGRSPLLSIAELAAMGYRMAIFPQSCFRAASFTTAALLADLHREGTQKGWLDRMQPREQLYRTLKYDPQADVWPEISQEKTP